VKQWMLEGVRAVAMVQRSVMRTILED
jgi:hypothetical protein